MAERHDTPSASREQAAAALERAFIGVVREESEARGTDVARVLEGARLPADLIDQAEAGKRQLRWQEVMALSEELGVRASELTSRAEARARRTSGR